MEDNIKRMATFLKPTTEQLEDIKKLQQLSTESNFQLWEKYRKLLSDNNLDPDLYVPNLKIECHDDDFMNNTITVVVEAMPIKMIQGIPINQITFED